MCLLELIFRRLGLCFSLLSSPRILYNRAVYLFVNSETTRRIVMRFLPEQKLVRGTVLFFLNESLLGFWIRNRIVAKIENLGFLLFKYDMKRLERTLLHSMLGQVYPRNNIFNHVDKAILHSKNRAMYGIGYICRKIALRGLFVLYITLVFK